MTALNPHQHSAPPSPPCSRVIKFQRRLGVSSSVALVLAEHALGDRPRADLSHLAALTAERVASSLEARHGRP